MRKMERLLLLTAVVCVSVLAIVAGVAEAKGKKDKKGKPEEKPAPAVPVWPSPLDPGKIDPVFKELPFNDSQEKFLVELKARLTDQLKPVLRATLDPRERDALNAKMGRTIEDFENSHVEFIGQQTGYGVSVVAEEYQDRAGESLYKYAYSQNTAYFFFSGKILWKMVICSESNTDVAALLVSLATVYGDPKEILHLDEEKTRVDKAVWQDTTFEFTVTPPRGIFTCSRLVWIYAPLMETIQQRRTAAAGAAAGESVEDSLLKSVTEENDTDEGDIVDRILKNKQKKSEEKE